MANDRLREYSAKRTFAATPEPPARVAEGAGGPLLFVVQKHEATRLHYDVRLECDGVLKSWAVPKGPSLDPSDKRLAMATEDHPFEYASFEGVIPPKQYGAGEVIVWDCGVYSPDEDRVWFHDRKQAEARVRAGLAKGKLSVQLRGEKLKGSFALVRTAKDPKSWLLIKHRDGFVTDVDITAQDRSVLSHATVAEIAARRPARMPAARLVPRGRTSAMPRSLAPMQAEPADAPFNHDDWSWEPKLDGYRVLAFVDAHGVRLQSRRGQDLTPAFPALAAGLAGQQVQGLVLDGEIVALGADGRPSFHALQNRVQLRTARERAAADRDTPAVFFAFDLLHFAGVDLRAAPYRDRRRYLAQCLLPGPLVQRMHASDDGVALHEAAVAAGFEGVVGKRKDSPYEAGRRSAAWVKVKPTRTAEFVIGGYTRGKGARSALGAILVGTWREGRLEYASHVGSGFDDRTLKQMQAALAPLARKTCPFAEKPELPNPTTWVEPERVAEVKFHSWTSDRRLRAPVFLRLRDDVDPKTVRSAPAEASTGRGARGTARADSRRADGDRDIADVVAQLENPRKDLVLDIGPHHIKLTHLDRVYWPAAPALDQPPVTKRELLRYFAEISPYILPHLRDRPLTMIRYPAGLGGQRFFQKHWDQAKPGFVETMTIFSESKDESTEHLLVHNLPTLLWLAQSGTLEFHVWHSRARVADDSASRSDDTASSLEALEASVLNLPDYVVFDIDPYIYSGQEPKGAEPELNTIAFEKGKEVAFWLRDLLATMKLDAIVKTSGKTGLHVFVPIRRTIDFDQARHVSELVGRHLMRLHPKDITMEWSVPKRTGKIFMDHNMNARAKTLNVAYSPRGIDGAPVSMPLTWDELAQAHPLDFRVTNAAARVKRTGDRWHDALERKQSLERALDAAGDEHH